MKQVSFLIFFSFLVISGMAQSLEDINAMMVKNDLPSARTAIDKYMENPKKAKDAEGWYFKGRVYNSISADKSLDLKTRKELKEQALEAFKTNQALDRKDVRMKLEMYHSYLDLYFGFYELGATAFNEKNYEAAYDAFMKALEVKDFILSKNYVYDQVKLYPLDTALVMNSGLAATLAKKEDVGISHYKKLADANVSGKDYEAVYETLAAYYNTKEDSASLMQILSKAKKLYPSNPYLAELEMRSLSKSGNKDALFARYEDLLVKEPTNFANAYNYSIEMYNSLYVGDDKPANVEATKTRLTEVLKTAISNDTAIDATILMTNHLFNAAADKMTEAGMIKGTKPEDVKKKKELNDEAHKLMDLCIPYAEKAVAYFDAKPSLKPGQKAARINLLGSLSDIYNTKNNPKKAAEYDKLKLKGL